MEKQQKKLQQELNKMGQSKEVMERNIHAYDKDVKWQLAEPGALMSAKAYQDKKYLSSTVLQSFPPSYVYRQSSKAVSYNYRLL